MNPADEAKLARLMRAAISGDETAYAEFLRVAAAMVRGLVRRRLREDGVTSVEDVVQETLLAVHAKRQTWRAQEAILPWLFTIARYKIVDIYRRRGARIFVDIEDVADLLAAPEAPAIDGNERYLERAVSGLSKGQQRVMRAIAVDGRSIAETASELGMRETAVRVAFHRGLAAVAAKFGRQS